MLYVKSLVIKDNQHDLVYVDDLSFTLNSHDKIAIIGTEGSGKSTLLNVLKGEQISYITVEGEISRPSVISYLDQNIKDRWHDDEVSAYLSADSIYDFYDHIAQIAKMCQSFGLDYEAIINRKIGTLSGGECVKVGLIKCLMIKSDILLLDEPSNDLDFHTLLWLERFMCDTDIPLVFISHDQRLLENVSNGIIHLQHINKKTIAKTYFLRENYKIYKEKYFNKLESDLMIARKQRFDYDKKIKRFRAIYQKVEYQQNQAVRNPGLAASLKKKIRNLKSQEHRYEKEKKTFIDTPEKEEPMYVFFEHKKKINTQRHFLDLDLQEFKLKDGRTLGNIKLSLVGQDKIVLIGDNGIGKSTLIQYIYDELMKTNGNIGYISQVYFNHQEKEMTVIDYLMSCQKTFDESKIRQILGTFGLKKTEMLYQLKYLSEGTKLKVILLKITSNQYDVLLLDEPTRNISPINQDELYQLFLSFKGAILAVTHDRTSIESVFDDIYELSEKGLNKITEESDLS